MKNIGARTNDEKGNERAKVTQKAHGNENKGIKVILRKNGCPLVAWQGRALRHYTVAYSKTPWQKDLKNDCETFSVYLKKITSWQCLISVQFSLHFAHCPMDIFRAIQKYSISVQDRYFKRINLLIMMKSVAKKNSMKTMSKV